MNTTVAPLLFQPLTIRSLTLKNRVVISPMMQHAAPHSVATAWHLVHLGKFALGGAGLILVESTAVARGGRIGKGDLGLWSDGQVGPLAPSSTSPTPTARPSASSWDTPDARPVASRCGRAVGRCLPTRWH